MKIDEFFEKFPKCNAYSNKLFINEILSPMYGDYVEKVLDLTVPEVPTKLAASPVAKIALKGPKSA